MAAPQQAPRRERPGVGSPENALAGSPRAAGPSNNVRPLREPAPAWKVAKRPGSFEGDVAVKELRERMALAPDLPPAPPLREERGAVFGMIRRLTGLVTLAAICAYGFVWISTPRGEAERGSSPAGFQQMMGAEPADLVSAGRPAEDAGRFTPAVFRPPPVADDRAAAAMAIPPVAIPSTPPAERRQALARAAWPGTDLPRESPTTGTAAASVPTAAASLPNPASHPALAPRTDTAASPPAAPRVDAEEIATLLARGRTYLANGDIASARLVFRRASEAGDAQAALALGGTYDPLVLKSLGAIGVAADPVQARGWYRKAAELGSREASQRIDQLAQSTR